MAGDRTAIGPRATCGRNIGAALIGTVRVFHRARLVVSRATNPDPRPWKAVKVVAKPSSPSQLIVIGASAGGIEALSVVLSRLPANFPAPIVVAQHLAPGRVSLLAEVLRRPSSLPVRTIAGRQELGPGVVYVVPANRHAEVTNHAVSLLEAGVPGPKPSVDRLLSSAATAFGEGLIAVILSGSGSDGAAGAHLVKQHGGTVIVENPETAKFSGMPRSLAPSTVDFVTDLEKIGPLLVDLLSGATAADHPATKANLESFLDEVGTRSGIDFRGYKRSTVRRRLQRRLSVTGARNLETYRDYLHKHPEEYDRLVASFLIKVTEFFRDPDLFAQLRGHILPDVIAHARAHGNVIRLWSAGCATGEEAYSLAISLCEALGEDLDQFDVRIFATDLDPDAVAFARRGTYPVTALTNVDSELVARYFTEEQGEYLVNKRLRSLIIFGQHDLGQRPPFPNIDLVLCRNVLIYFANDLQDRALRLFAFALREAGYLVLGKAEIASPLADFLRLEDPALKIYRRHGGPVVLPPAQVDDVRRTSPLREFIRRTAGNERALFEQVMHPVRPMRLRPWFERLDEILLHVPVGIVLITANYDIQYINNVARGLLGIRGPAVGQDVIHASVNAPPRSLKEAIDEAFRGRSAARLAQMATEDATSGKARYVDVTCVPYSRPDRANEQELAALVLVDVTEHVQAFRDLSAELAEARRARENLEKGTQRLTAGIRELEVANQDLAAQNTALQAANEVFAMNTEEVQAASEEVETLNEELQATNEELETLNEELQATVEELNTANEDLNARSLELQDLALTREQQREEAQIAKDRLEVVIASIGSALVVVDAHGRFLLANRSYDEIMGIADGGGRIEDLEGKPLPPDMLPERRAARGESFNMDFVIVDKGGGRRWFEAVGNPLRDERQADGAMVHSGGVVVIRDMTDRALRRLQDEFLATASHELRTPITAVSLYAGLLTRLLGAAEMDGQLRQILDGLVFETRRMSLLVNDLMDAGRLQSGQVPLGRQSLDLVQVLRRAADLAQHMAKGQRIQAHLPDDEVRVDGDPNRLEQVIINLLENAIVYAEGTKCIDLRLRVTDGQAEVEVQDYGPGIPSADLPHVFTRFYRGSSAGRRAAGGLGLGLYISHQLVAAHGGHINVRSVEGEGTVFTILLPLAT
jgi:two-component system CheB/CheR fusion protein